MSDDAGTDALARTPLFDEHQELGATLVGFAGYAMPVRYGFRHHGGAYADAHCRRPLRRLPPWGQLRLTGPNAVKALERLVPGDIAGLAPMAMRYTQFINDDGGHPRRLDRHAD